LEEIMNLRFWLPILGASCGISCASTATVPSEKATSSSAAIRAAEEVGATHNPDSALYLQLAKEQFEHARMLTNAKDKDWADRLLVRAETDAELSLALARTDNERAAARGAIDKAKTLREPVVQ
jgi:hypothetical protein